MSPRFLFTGVLKQGLLASVLCCLAGAADAGAATPPDGQLRLVLEVPASEGTQGVAGFTFTPAPGATPWQVGMLLVDGEIQYVVNLPDSGRPPLNALRIGDYVTFTDIDGIKARVTLFTTPFDFVTAPQNGGAVGFDPLSISGELMGPFLPACAPPANGGFQPANEETCEERLRRLYPDGNCTRLVRDAVEKLIKSFRSQGMSEEADTLEETLDRDTYIVDFDHTYTSATPCNMTALLHGFPWPGMKMWICPECLCESNADWEIALAAGGFAMKHVNDAIDPEGSFFKGLAFALSQSNESNWPMFRKFLEVMGKLYRAAEGPYPRIACLADAMARADDYRGTNSSNPAEALARLEAALAKLRTLMRDFNKLTEQQKREYETNVFVRMQTIQALIVLQQWETLQMVFGIPRECIDPALLKFDKKEEFEGLLPTADGDVERKPGTSTGEHTIAVPLGEQGFVGLIDVQEERGFAAPLLHAVTGEPRAVRWGQFDNYPAPDVAVVTRYAGVKLLLNPGAGVALQQPVPFLNPITQIAVADLDADGRPDLIGLSATAGTLEVLRQTQFGFVSATNIVLPPGASGDNVLTLELTGDSFPDVVVTGPTGVQVYRNRGGPTNDWRGLEWRQTLSTPVVGPVLAVDLDGDRRDDLAFAGGEGRTLFIARNTGALSFNLPQPLPALEGVIGGIAAGDFDNDGRRDLAIGLANLPKLVAIFRPLDTLAGAANVRSNAVWSIAGPVRGLFSRDLNADGDLDLLVVRTDGLTMMQRLFSEPYVDCVLRLGITHPAGVPPNVVDVAPVLPPAQGSLRLLYRDTMLGEWQEVTAADLLLHTSNFWRVRVTVPQRFLRATMDLP